jgi:hypothetical protein
MVFNEETFLAVHLGNDIGWIFVDTDDSHLIRNKYGKFRIFYKGLDEEHRDPNDYYAYILCENEVNGKLCFHTHKLTDHPGDFKHPCCGCEDSPNHHVKKNPDIVSEIQDEIDQKGAEEALRDRYFKLIIDHRIPFTQASSETFRCMIYASILAGRVDNRLPTEIFPQLSRKRISELARRK